MMSILEAGNFTRVARGGLGRPNATMAHAMTEFRGQLYVGTSSTNARGPEDAPRILRHEGDGQWRVVHESALITDTGKVKVDIQLPAQLGRAMNKRGGEKEGGPQLVPAETGYRSMVVFQGPSDPEPALYVATMSFSGGQILRSTDGETFTAVSEPGMGNPGIFSFRGLTAHGGRLFASAAGTVEEGSIDRNMAPEAVIYVSDDPAKGVWKQAAEPGFGDPANKSIYTLRSAHGFLYAGTGNPERGFQVWRTTAEGEAPFEWLPVAIDGAFGFNHNLAATAMAEFHGALYVGSGITGFGYDKVYDIGPAACELIRIWPDGSWDLIAGRPRFTPDGLKVPLSMLGPGLDDPFNSVVWSLCVHEDVLYLGTHQWEAFRALEVAAEEVYGGYQLWASADGEQWSMVLEDGGGNPGDVGVRTLVSTSQGLFVGTCNHLPLLTFMARLRGRTLELADRRGFEVLLGR